MREPWCATCRVGSINCAGNDCHPFKDWPRCWRITWTESSTTAAPKYVSGWWKPSTATSKPFLEGAAATKISPTYCSKHSAWQSQKQNLSFFRKRHKMQAPSNSCAEPEILSAIGAGGMGEVYEARDNKLGRNVAIKVLPEAFAHDSDRLSRFEREARMLAALNH